MLSYASSHQDTKRPVQCKTCIWTEYEKVTHSQWLLAIRAGIPRAGASLASFPPINAHHSSLLLPVSVPCHVRPSPEARADSCPYPRGRVHAYYPLTQQTSQRLTLVSFLSFPVRFMSWLSHEDVGKAFIAAFEEEPILLHVWPKDIQPPMSRRVGKPSLLTNPRLLPVSLKFS
jgi:hypothetical protein